MRNAMIASTKVQAVAMIDLLKLNPEEWEPITYGQPIKRLVGHAKLVRPSDGMERAHVDWILSALVPNLCLTATTVPPHWSIPQEYIEN
ncbi:hypothetical protein [Bradyrhizobium sp. SZCCHNS3053]|uniref:hypothetical protein n=1 Tax=Bradyrhizobium sp. SZCCHNS3053 TaxID=3057322 RepID=UPI0029162311|nr:hypothetical protein [Bradyrhizobium sp. SZCCHNS3053]